MPTDPPSTAHADSAADTGDRRPDSAGPDAPGADSGGPAASVQDAEGPVAEGRVADGLVRAGPIVAGPIVAGPGADAMDGRALGEPAPDGTAPGAGDRDTGPPERDRIAPAGCGPHAGASDEGAPGGVASAGGDVDLRHHGDAEVGPGLVDMAVNVRPGTPPAWLAAVLRETVSGLASYPDPRRARDAVARRHGRHPDDVLLTAGAAEAFVLLARALRPRRAVVVHPQFTEPEAALRAAGHEVTRVVLGDGFRLGAGFGENVPDDADLVMIGNPTNPTSVLHPAAAIARLARPGRVLVVDEAFMDCVPGEPESLASGRLLPGTAGEPATTDGRALPGLVVIRSLTKTWGLAGLRAGYLLAEPWLVARMAEVQPLWSVSAPALTAIEVCVDARALAEAQAWAHELAVERERLAAGIRALGPFVVPQARASFLCVRFAGAARVRELLRERGYAVRRGDTFPGLGPGWLRVAVRDRTTNAAFLGTLKDVLACRDRKDGNG